MLLLTTGLDAGHDHVQIRRMGMVVFYAHKMGCTACL